MGRAILSAAKEHKGPSMRVAGKRERAAAQARACISV